MKQVTIHDFKARLSHYLRSVAAGEELVIAPYGRSAAYKVVAIKKKNELSTAYNRLAGNIPVSSKQRSQINQAFDPLFEKQIAKEFYRN